jgi:peptide/nickel transport system permease protein
MWKYIANRLVQIVITLFVFFALTYFLLDAQPGDITLQYMNNPRFTPEQREALQRRLGLDRPVYERFFKWMGNTLQGDLGESYQYRRPVMEIMIERAPRTIFLFLSATLIEFFLGYWIGKQLAWSRGTAVEMGTTVVGAVLFTVFTPWLGLMMIYLFGFTLKWLPIGKFLDVSLWRTAEVNANFIFNRLLLTGIIFTVAIALVYYLTRRMNTYRARWIRTISVVAFTVIALGVWAASQYGELAGDIVYHMILPISLLTVVNFAGTMLLTRTTMLETLKEDYVMAARAKGISERQVRDKHAARNALLPVFTSLIISLPFILAGGIITETIFSWEGMGLTLLTASTTGDIPMVMGAFLFIGTLALLAHLVADVMYAFLDPRIRYA